MHSGIILAITGLFLTAHARADCVMEAAERHYVNPLILHAIAQQESGGRADAVNRNANGTLDRGAFQINSIHLPELKQHGIDASDLHDPCKSAYIAAWLLRREMNRAGNTWEAVGRYHSNTPFHRDKYAAAIMRRVQRMGARQ